MDILGYVKCTAPNCDAPMEVTRCNGKRSAFLKGRCNVCQCTEQRSNANTQHYLKQYMPLEAFNKALEVQTESLLEADDTDGVPSKANQVLSQAPNQDTPKPKKSDRSASGWLCAGIGAGLGFTIGKAFTVLKAI